MEKTEISIGRVLPSFILLILSIVLTIVVNRFSKKYRSKKQPEIITQGKWKLNAYISFSNYALVTKNLLIVFAFFASVYNLGFTAMEYFYSGSGLNYYNSIFLMAVMLILCIITVYISLSFMFANSKHNLFKVLNGLPSTIKVAIFVLSWFGLGVIHMVGTS